MSQILEALTVKPVLAQAEGECLQIDAPWLAELYRAVAADQLVCVYLDRTCDSTAALRDLRHAESLGRPVLAILSDDDGEAAGPVGWPCARDVMAWAAFVFVHGSGGATETYHGLEVATGLFGRVALIESASQTALAWASAAVAAGQRPVVMMPLDNAAADTEAVQ